MLLGGAANLIRDPRNGRNFEYFSEDPLLTGTMAGEAIAGVEDNRIISTLKHFALNAQETDRVVLDARIDPAAMRESDLLAFELAIERGHPHSVMCAYNQVNGRYACENDWLLGRVLKRDWHYPGFVMSDWGAVHSTIASALAGLDQESGEQLDTENFFAEPLERAIEDGSVPQARLDDMVGRILTAIFASGVYDHPPKTRPRDTAADEATARGYRGSRHRAAEEQSDPAAAANHRAHRDHRCPCGPRRAVGRRLVPGGPDGRHRCHRSGAERFSRRAGVRSVVAPRRPSGSRRRERRSPTTMAATSRRRRAARPAADVALVFADQWTTETADVPDLSLPEPQDKLIEAVARANARTIVILETGDPVTMPWLDRVAGVLEAWYPGQRGGTAIARILFGEVDPSGHLPLTFPRDENQLPRPKVPGDPAGAPRGPVGRGGSYGQTYAVDYGEGAAVGYKWFARTGAEPLFPFGFGLSYTGFAMTDLQAGLDGAVMSIRVSVRNVGDRAGAAVPQLYLSRPGEISFPVRLVGWSKVDLSPGEQRHVSVSIDPRLLAHFSETEDRWKIEPGLYRVSAGFDAAHLTESTDVAVGAASLAP